MKKFADVNLNIPDKEEMVKFAKELGFRTIAVSISENSQPSELLKLGEKYGVEIVRRVNLKPSTVQELMIKLNQWRFSCVLIAVECRSAVIARQAARDRRVDLLNFPIQNLKLFDKPEAELASEANAALEIVFNSVVKLERKMLPSVIGVLRWKIGVARKYKIPVIASSGAASLLEMRTPRDMAAFFQLCGLSVDESLNAFSKYPLEIIKKNKVKLNGKQVSVGVRSVERS